MVDDNIANTTLTKLIKAAKRGVSVVLFVDNLNFWLNPKLALELMKNGGVVKSINPLNPITRFMEGMTVFTKELWERYH
jgi:hypothetical protein|eukprot:CAMPEP_0168313556 /NCGR_PEP_ID=MMETSP0210-20121227/2673_1 /TAXON_ID=40633 /ORGANISM="Condylostoma magnum, Strain COL2" /LENGTH=78 /DNA_ID=CAMNT_0008271459 /DNA_START=1 /DNA_END=237 /DNA_ORIENTATION=-